ncbi:MAG: hypothetical protein WD824_09140 [Cyclobacteriaceae bacterium]
MSKHSQQVHFAIKEIKELEFFINENVELGEAFDYNYQVNVSHSVPAETIMVIITANYLLHQKTEHFMKGKTATTFLIRDLKNYVKKLKGKDGIDLPDALLITLFSISFSHARALLAKSSAGTKFSHMLMPLINPEQEFNKVFRHDFQNQTRQ